MKSSLWSPEVVAIKITLPHLKNLTKPTRGLAWSERDGTVRRNRPCSFCKKASQEITNSIINKIHEKLRDQQFNNNNNNNNNNNVYTG